MEQYQDYIYFCWFILLAVLVISPFQYIFFKHAEPSLKKLIKYTLLNSLDYFFRILIWGLMVMYFIKIQIYSFDELFFEGYPIFTVGVSIGLGRFIALVTDKMKNLMANKIDSKKVLKGKD